MYRASNRHGNTENPELVALFSRCSRLFGLPFLPLFVFDGPERPRVKRGKVISGNNHWLATSFQQMLDGFGFQWITVNLAVLSYLFPANKLMLGSWRGRGHTLRDDDSWGPCPCGCDSHR